MSPQIIVWVLSLLGLVVVALTRKRLGAEDSSSSKTVSRTILNVHTAVGALAVLVWAVFLVMPKSSFLGGPVVGIVALLLWWVTAFAGLALLLRWLPSHGRHADVVGEDEWAEGPGLSLLAHIGLLLGVLVFTWAFATGVV
ncbi:hypothetical protein [Nocardioides gilvus]|uniref:hypothetical protein n=1 Tax=Nocardioides gilvus TaxID=1735589 RepID=UPI000D74CDE8|nr:hypothetical protein [Nocardioides gilvus]